MTRKDELRKIYLETNDGMLRGVHDFYTKCYFDFCRYASCFTGSDRPPIPSRDEYLNELIIE